MSKNTSGSLKRGLAVIKTCAANSAGVSFGELKNYCGDLSATALTRVLKPLLEEGMIRKDSDTGLYHAGDSLIGIAKSILEKRSRAEIIQPILDELSTSTEESSAYFDWDGSWVTLKAKTETTHSFHYAPLGSRETHKPTNNFFKVVLAYQSQKIIEKIYKTSNSGKFTSQKIYDKIVKDKLLVADEKIRGTVLRVVAPVFLGRGGALAGSIGITSSILEPDEAELEYWKNHVQAAAQVATDNLAS